MDNTIFILIAAFLIIPIASIDHLRYANILRVNEDNLTTIDPASERCFHYTWLADENNETFYSFLNKTCFDKFGTYKPTPLCVNPMVITDNGGEPDNDWLAKYRYESTTCKLMDGYVCAKYSYRFNGKVQNVTRYCTKITVDSNSMQSGCISTTDGPDEIEVCACSGMLGNMPCNSAIQLNSYTLSFMFVVFLFASIWR